MGRQGFAAPTGDRRYTDPELPGGGGGVEHMNGNGLSTYTPDPSELDRYRGMGEAAAKRQAYNVDFSKAQGDEAQGLQARDAQVAGIDNMRRAAMGNAPSQAAILGGQVGGQSLQQSMAAGAGGRGLGAAAAQMQAQQGMGQGQLGAMGQYTGMRGAEMQHAQQSYGQAGGQMRAGDYTQQGMAQQRAEAQGQAELGQRQLNQGAQMGYEQMGINDQQQNVDAQARKAAMQAQANADQQASHDARNARNLNGAIAGMSAIGSFGASVAGNKSDARVKQNITTLSDENTKEDVTPLGGSASIGAAVARLRAMYHKHEQGGADPADVASIRGMDPDAKARRDLHRAMADGGAGATPYATPSASAPHGLDRMRYESRVHADWNDAGGGPKEAIEIDGPGGKTESRLLGVTGAPEGYYGSRASQTGDVMGYGPEAKYDLGPRDPDGNMLSDDRTKLVAAQREAFTAGLKHASDAQETGSFGPVPDYVEGHGKRQPAAADRKAATPLAKADPAKQNAENAASQGAYDRANLSSLAAVPLGYGGTLGALHGTLAEDHIQQSRRPTPPPAPTPSLASRAPQAMSDALSHAYPAPAGDGPIDMSDERAKQDKHAESDMGAALEQGYKPFEYEYKDGFRESEGQKPGEKNVGPMAQNMAKNSITGNAVEQGPDGLLRISIPKTVKTNSAGIGYLAAKMRRQDEEIAKLKGGR